MVNHCGVLRLELWTMELSPCWVFSTQEKHQAQSGKDKPVSQESRVLFPMTPGTYLLMFLSIPICGTEIKFGV